MVRTFAALSVLALAVSSSAAARSAAQAPAPAPPAAQAPAPAPPAAPSPAATAAGAATPESVADFLGDWTLNAEGPNGPATFALAVKADEGKVTADISSEMQPHQAITDVSKGGASLILKYMFDYQGTPVPVVVTLKPADDKVGVQLDFADGAYLMTGTATKKKI
jgi:glucose/arabinose dehydrogenase